MEASPNYSHLIEVLLMWQRLQRGLQANTPLISWGQAQLLVASADSLDRYARSQLADALSQSDVALFPLRDPMKLNLGSHRWLSADREESYSDWLAWILQGMSDATEILPLFALGDDASAGAFGRAEKVQREAPSEYGRTDVEVWFGDRALLLIEVKVQPTGTDLPSQLRRYERWAARKRVRRTIFVLLGTEEPRPGIDLGHFAFVGWRDLCMRLRQYAVRTTEFDLLRAAAVLIFCGATEQNLLNLSERPGRFRAKPTVDYLRTWSES